MYQGFYNSVVLFSKALLAPRLLVGHLLWIRQGGRPFTRGVSLHFQNAHTHTTHMYSHPSLCILSQCTPPPLSPHKHAHRAHTHYVHTNLSHHTHPTRHTIHPRYTLPHTPTHTHIPLPTPSIHINTPRTHACHMSPPAAHTHSHTHIKNLTVTRLPHPICPVHTQIFSHLPCTCQKDTPTATGTSSPSNQYKGVVAPSPEPWEVILFLLTGSPLPEGQS